jgi:hypothetical protein
MAEPKIRDTGTKIELNAVIVVVDGYEPQVLIDPALALPSGPFETGHPTLEQGLRASSGLPLGYIEQLYTFADRDRKAGEMRSVSIGYLALMHAASAPKGMLWSSWYRHFPWEDHREGPPRLITDAIMPGLEVWKTTASSAASKETRAHRIHVAFPKDMRRWNEELVLQRYELLWEAGLVAESAKAKTKTPLGVALAHDHRRILATAMARLRAKIKYRPVVFELMPEAFTLLQLQEAVEALAGLRLHKQNFRRLVEAQGLVEETGAVARLSSGRPAKLFAFRRDVLIERAAVGTKLPRSS